jgi:hypothetical protein
MVPALPSSCVSSLLVDMKLRDGPDIVGGVLGGSGTGFAAYVILQSLRPFPNNALSAFIYVSLAATWILVSLWFWKRALVWRKIEITEEKITEERFFLVWRMRTRVVLLDGRHFVDFSDFRGGFPTSREWTSCFFAGPGARITIDVSKGKSQPIKEIASKRLGNEET